MKKIAYILPYFGHLPKEFGFWLISCQMNPTVDWLLFTDDRTKFNYPPNVKVTYCTFEDIKNKAQACFDFPIVLNRPYKLCDYKAAYGDIFKNELTGYDYWGMCDLDLVWGNIREFLTDEILEKYDRIGNQGHSTLFKNNPDVNLRYKKCIGGLLNYRDVYTSEKSFCFDESGLDAIYNALEIPYYHEVNFAHLLKYNAGFFLGLLPEEEAYKNNRQVLLWKDGNVFRFYLHEDKVKKEKYMYCHFWCRPITYTPKNYSVNKQYLMYADKVIEWNSPITSSVLKKYGRPNSVVFMTKSLWKNRHKITLKKIIFNIKGMASHVLHKEH